MPTTKCLGKIHLKYDFFIGVITLNPIKYLSSSIYKSSSDIVKLFRRFGCSEDIINKVESEFKNGRGEEI
jgi:hypothetical protein